VAARLPADTAGTCDHDDRVVPGHSFKFAAAQTASAPILLRVYSEAGHSRRGRPTAMAIAEAADRLAFLDGALRMTAVPR
jgi:prolyl oligopeptidase